MLPFKKGKPKVLTTVESPLPEIYLYVIRQFVTNFASFLAGNQPAQGFPIILEPLKEHRNIGADTEVAHP